jgi:tetratricopeptide (TPR) repeat protein
LQEDVAMIFENAKRLICSGNTIHAEIIFYNIEKSIFDKAAFLNVLGKFYYDLQLFEKAEYAYKRVLDFGIKNKDIFQNLGMTAFSIGKYNESAKYFDEALKIINGENEKNN